jgi:hypothetical protein
MRLHREIENPRVLQKFLDRFDVADVFQVVFDLARDDGCSETR